MIFAQLKECAYLVYRCLIVKLGLPLHWKPMILQFT